MWCHAHSSSHSSTGHGRQCCQSTATVTAGTGTSSVCTETFVMSCSLITEVQVVFHIEVPNTAKATDQEKSEFLGTQLCNGSGCLFRIMEISLSVLRPTN